MYDSRFPEFEKVNLPVICVSEGAPRCHVFPPEAGPRLQEAGHPLLRQRQMSQHFKLSQGKGYSPSLNFKPKKKCRLKLVYILHQGLVEYC